MQSALPFAGQTSTPAASSSTRSDYESRNTMSNPGGQIAFDEALLARCRANDPQAIDALLGRYERYIYATAYRLSGNHEDAEDLVSETTLRIFRHIGEFQHAVTLPAWIKRIVTNVYFDTCRSLQRKPSVSLDALVEQSGDMLLTDEASTSNSPHLQAEAHERKRILADAIQSLPPSQQEIVTLFHGQEQSYEEIAARMKVPVGTVKSRLNRARAALRLTLEPQMSTLVS